MCKKPPNRKCSNTSDRENEESWEYYEVISFWVTESILFQKIVDSEGDIRPSGFEQQLENVTDRHQEIATLIKKYFTPDYCDYNFNWDINILLNIVSTMMYILYKLDKQNGGTEKYTMKHSEYLKFHSEISKIKDHEKRDISFRSKTIPYQILSVFPVSLNNYFESLSSGNTMTLEESMSNNLLRIHSFNNFPREVNIFTSFLARAGFYYTGVSDEVRCYACGITHRKWTSRDDPIAIHRRLSPSCSHVINLYSTDGHSYSVSANSEQLSVSSPNSTYYHPNNTLTTSVPRTDSTTYSHNFSSTNTSMQNQCTSSISDNERHNSVSRNGPVLDRNNTQTDTTTNPSFSKNEGLIQNRSSANRNNDPPQCENDTFTTNGISTHFQSKPNEYSKSSETKHPFKDNLSSTGINVEKPRYQDYAPLQVRISSYQGWPSYLDQTPRDMAKAGFLYAGYQDYTRCFFCGGGLRNWEAGDDPWVEHARWFPKCVYLRQSKGDKFVEAVQEKHTKLEKEKNGGTSQNSRYELPALQNVEASQTSACVGHQSNNHLDTVAARSVLEMGYSEEKVLQAIHKITPSYSGGNTITAVDIMQILLSDENKGTASSSSTTDSGISMSPSTTSTNGTDNTTVENLNLDDYKLDDAELLVEENRQLKDLRLCKICLELNASIAFLPCGHLVCCADCAPAMRKCPICRGYVKGTVKTFLA